MRLPFLAHSDRWARSVGGSQSTGWLYFVWHCGFALFVIGYALIKDVDRGTAGEQGSAVGTISSIIGIMIALICGLTWAINAHESNLPRAIGADVSFFARHVPGMVMLVLGLLAIALLWRRRISVLDLWLIVVMFAFLFEIMRVAIGNYPRFSFGFYTVRIFSLVTSTIVLLVLLSQTTALYARLACSNTMLKRERDNKLMNLEAMAASISHEVRQPLTAITTHGSAALRFLGQAPPNLERAQTSMRAVVSDSHRASEVFDNLRTLFGRADKEQEPIDVNEIAHGALRIMQGELKENRITTRVELAPELAAVAGHKGQLQEVFLNLIRNAIDAMGATEDGSRLLRVVTENGRDQNIVAVEDSGPGIDPEKLDRIFDVFVTSKAQGMGLGLAICRMIIDRHGGQLSAWSDKKRGGALFQFTLPIKSAAG